MKKIIINTINELVDFLKDNTFKSCSFELKNGIYIVMYEKKVLTSEK